MLIRRHPIDIIQLVPKRIKSAHKGTVGRLLIVAGSETYTGSAALMVEAALRAGIGIVYAIAVIVSPKSFGLEPLKPWLLSS